MIMSLHRRCLLSYMYMLPDDCMFLGVGGGKKGGGGGGGKKTSQWLSIL